MTTNETRQKLGAIIEKVFTDTFARKYKMIAAQVPGSYLENYPDDVDAYVELVAGHLDSPQTLDRLSKIANPLTVFELFMRYHMITQDFISDDQTRQRDFPENNPDFVRAILIKHWYSEVHPKSR